MQRQIYLDLAAAGLRMPIGTHLALHEQPEPEAVLLDGQRLGETVVSAAQRYHTPLAFPLMDLDVERQALLEMLDLHGQTVQTFNFGPGSLPDALQRLETRMATYESARIRAAAEALAYVAKHADLVPIGMAIGPFSLMTKLVRDPIAAVYLAGRGMTAVQEARVAAIEGALELATRVIEWSLRQQIAAGAKAIMICEPAASTAYISPRQLAAGADTFERYVMVHNRRIGRFLAAAGVDLLFHCCGEISDAMLRGFGELEPAILSLGSSRRLWEDARLLPKTTVLFGNLPSKKFFSDSEITYAEVAHLAGELVQKMRASGHPFILGTECDVLSVAGRHELIKQKVQAFLSAPCV